MIKTNKFWRWRKCDQWLQKKNAHRIMKHLQRPLCFSFCTFRWQKNNDVNNEFLFKFHFYSLYRFTFKSKQTITFTSYLFHLSFHQNMSLTPYVKKEITPYVRQIRTSPLSIQNLDTSYTNQQASSPIIVLNIEDARKNPSRATLEFSFIFSHFIFFRLLEFHHVV